MFTANYVYGILNAGGGGGGGDHTWYTEIWTHISYL